MTDGAGSVVELAATLLAVGGGTSVAILILAYIVKGAIVTAVEEAGKQELVRMKGELDERLASKRQEFEAVMEETRRAASRDLESFKAELQLPAEVRRHVAAKRVELLVKVGDLGEALQLTMLNVRPDGSDRQEAMVKVHDFCGLVRSSSFLVEREVAAKFLQYAANLIKAEVELDRKMDASAFQRMVGETDEFLQLVRVELGVSTR